MFRGHTRRWAAIICVAVIAYCGIYTALSLAGEYRPDASGARRYPSGLALIDTRVWQPAGFNVPSDLKYVVRGFFWPLHVIDRSMWHGDEDFFAGEPDL